MERIPATTLIDAYARATGEILRDIRRRRGLTLREVGRRSGGTFRPTSVAGYERGERSISLRRFCELATFYGTSPDSLLTEIVRRTRRGGNAVVDLSTLDPDQELESPRRLEVTAGDQLSG